MVGDHDSSRLHCRSMPSVGGRVVIVVVVTAQFNLRNATEKVGQERLVERALEQVTADACCRVDHFIRERVKLDTPEESPLEAARKGEGSEAGIEHERVGRTRFCMVTVEVLLIVSRKVRRWCV